MTAPPSAAEPAPDAPLVLLLDLVALVRTGADDRPLTYPLGRLTLLAADRHDWRGRLAGGLREAAATVHGATVDTRDRDRLRRVRDRAVYTHHPDHADDVRFLLGLLDTLVPSLVDDLEEEP